VSKFRKFERRTTVEEKDMNLEPEEDTEGHVHQVNVEPDEAVNAGREDESDEVEGHVNLAVNLEAADAVQIAREDEDDDVEGHVNIN